VIYSNRTGSIAEDTIGTGCFQNQIGKAIYRVGTPYRPLLHRCVYIEAFDRSVLDTIYYKGDPFPLGSGRVSADMRLRARMVSLASLGLSASDITNQIRRSGPQELTIAAARVSRQQVAKAIKAFRYVQSNGGNLLAGLVPRRGVPLSIPGIVAEKWRGIDVSDDNFGLCLSDDPPRKMPRLMWKSAHRGERFERTKTSFAQSEYMNLNSAVEAVA
jgi:hypothetical protein